MNKYLHEKINQAHGAYFENLIFIGSEACRETSSEAMQEFESIELSEMCEVLNWRNDKEVHDMIISQLKEGGLAFTLLENRKTGFLAECHMPECSDFKTDQLKTKPTRWRINPGICEVFWIYGDSIGQLVHKLEKETKKRFMKMYEESQSKEATK